MTLSEVMYCYKTLFDDKWCYVVPRGVVGVMWCYVVLCADVWCYVALCIIKRRYVTAFAVI